MSAQSEITRYFIPVINVRTSVCTVIVIVIVIVIGGLKSEGLAKPHEGERFKDPSYRGPDYPRTIDAKGSHTFLVSAIQTTAQPYLGFHCCPNRLVP